MSFVAVFPSSSTLSLSALGTKRVLRPRSGPSHTWNARLCRAAPRRAAPLGAVVALRGDLAVTILHALVISEER